VIKEITTIAYKMNCDNCGKTIKTSLDKFKASSPQHFCEDKKEVAILGQNMLLNCKQIKQIKAELQK